MGSSVSVSKSKERPPSIRDYDIPVVYELKTELRRLDAASADVAALDAFIDASQTITANSRTGRPPEDALVTETVAATMLRHSNYFDDIHTYLEAMQERLSKFGLAVADRCKQYEEDEQHGKMSRVRQQINMSDELIMKAKDRLQTAKTDKSSTHMIQTLKRQVQDLELFKVDLKSSDCDSARSRKCENLETILQNEGGEHILEDILNWRDEALKLRRKYESLLDDNEKIKTEGDDVVVQLHDSNKRLLTEMIELRRETSAAELRADNADIRVQTIEEKILEERLTHEVEINSLKALLEKRNDELAKMKGGNNWKANSLEDDLSPRAGKDDVRLTPEGILEPTEPPKSAIHRKPVTSDNSDRDSPEETNNIKSPGENVRNSADSSRDWIKEFEPHQRAKDSTENTTVVIAEKSSTPVSEKVDDGNNIPEKEDKEIKLTLDNLQARLNTDNQSETDDDTTDIETDNSSTDTDTNGGVALIKEHVHTKRKSKNSKPKQEDISQYENMNKSLQQNERTENKDVPNKEPKDDIVIVNSKPQQKDTSQSENMNKSCQQHERTENKDVPNKEPKDDNVIVNSKQQQRETSQHGNLNKSRHKNEHREKKGVHNKEKSKDDIVIVEEGPIKEIIYKRNDGDIDGNLSYYKGIGAAIKTDSVEFGVDSVQCDIVDGLENDMLPDFVEGERAISFHIHFQQRFGSQFTMRKGETLKVFVPHRPVNEFEEASLIQSIDGADWEPCDQCKDVPSSIDPTIQMVGTQLHTITDIKLVVIAREKSDNIIAGEETVKHISKYDKTVTVNINKDTFRSRAEVKLLIHHSHRNDMLSAIEIHSECNRIMSCTAFVSLICEQLTRGDITVVMDLPDETDSECKYTMFSLEDTGWKLADCDWQKEDHTLVVHLRAGARKYRVIGLELPTDMSVEERLSAVRRLHEHTGHYITRVLFRQRQTKPEQAVVICLRSVLVKRGIHQLKELGFNVGGYPSSQFCMQEGDTLSLQFSGEVKANPVNAEKMEVTFYSQKEIATRQLLLQPADMGASGKNSDMFQGFLSILRKDDTDKVILGETVNLPVNGAFSDSFIENMVSRTDTPREAEKK